MEKNKLIISIILIIIISAIMVVAFTIDKDNRLDVLTIKNKNIHQGQINAILNQYKSSNKFIFSSIINDNDILKLQRDALKTKDKKQQNKYRKELYNKLLNLYKNLKDYGVKQLHFHLPDSTSFLRFHKPNKFGDSLKDIRYSVVVTNKEKKPIYGFEEGRIFNGYRIIYPLFYNKEHIGSVEISIGFDAINKISIKNYNTYQYMILNKDIIEDKLFTNEKQNYEVSDLNKYFYHEINGFSNYKNMFLKQKDLVDYKTFNKINKTLSKTIKQKKLLKYKHILKFVKIDSGYYYISLLPIKNI
ncbi:MAG: cache domain-containing protein, partial [Campylobacterota bacterium]|nr:cache domain-containing protein [Campylobacterota bacterium]